ncbi:hypothetical protein K4F52_007752 [Lecanicillium sp. MT-2017a]|nr:hypothetical protein K4F52_007752 [Lecanicillium sp. MT-2017a]
MKSSVVAVGALATAVLAKPKFTNSDFNVQEDKPFELTFDGCDVGCTIVLQTGPSANLKDVNTLTTTATGSSFTWTPRDLSSGTYAFKIYASDDVASPNYSIQFTYEGTGSVNTGASSGAAATSDATTAIATSATAATTTTATAESSTGFSERSLSSESTSVATATTISTTAKSSK